MFLNRTGIPHEYADPVNQQSLISLEYQYGYVFQGTPTLLVVEGNEVIADFFGSNEILMAIQTGEVQSYFGNLPVDPAPTTQKKSGLGTLVVGIGLGYVFKKLFF